MTPTQDHSPPDGFRATEPDSDRTIGSVAELNERLRELGHEAIAIKAMVSAEAEQRRRNEAQAEQQRAHVAHGLLTLGEAVYALKTAVEGVKTEIDDMRASLASELASLRRHDSTSDEVVTATRLAVAKQATTIERLRAALTLRRVATYAVGTGGALALSTAALVLSRLALRWLGLEH